MKNPYIIDVHTHLGRTREFRAYWGSLEDFIHLMDLTHTQLSVFAPMPLLARQFELGYELAVESLRQYPDRLRAYMVFDPNWGDISLELMEKYRSVPGFVGIKIHPTMHSVAPDDSRYRPLWEFAETYRLVVLSHTWSPDPLNPAQNLSTPDRFASILQQYPHMNLIVGHAGGREVGNRLAVELLKHHANCWLDISGDSFGLGQLEWMAGEVGVDRILYGTDANWIEPRYQLGHVLKARLSAEDRYKIFRTNALTLFGNSIVEKLSFDAEGKA
jgi:uncharacterized protein